MTITIALPDHRAEPAPPVEDPTAEPLQVLPDTVRRRWDRIAFSGSARADADRHDDEPEDRESRTCPATDLPDAGSWSATLVRACVEALGGQRPVAQLTRWLDGDIWSALNRRALLGVQVLGRPVRPAPVRILRVHPCRISAEVWECSVVLHDGHRVRAAALRLELLRSRWRATALTIG